MERLKIALSLKYQNWAYSLEPSFAMKFRGLQVNFIVDFPYYFPRVLKCICFHCGDNLWPTLEVSSNILNICHILELGLRSFFEVYQRTAFVTATGPQENKVIWQIWVYQ